MTEVDVQPKRTGLLIWLIVSQIAAVGSLCAWPTLAEAAFFLLFSIYLPLAVVILALPIFQLVMAISAWVAFTRRKDKRAAYLSGLSFVPTIVFYLIFQFWINF